MRLKDKVAIVTGTGDGIGRGIALQFAHEDAHVAVCDINAETVQETGRLVEKTGRKAWFGRWTSPCTRMLKTS